MNAGHAPSNWTAEEWEAFGLIMAQCWRGDWTPARERAYGIVLDGYRPADVIAVVRRLIREGKSFLPTPSELVGPIAAAEEIVTAAPSWPEVKQMLFGRGGVLKVAPTPGGYTDARDRARRVAELALTRAESMHPYLHAFVAVQGVDRLRALPVDDPDYGELELKTLGERWAEHVERLRDRERNGVPLLPAGVGDRPRGDRRGLARFDPVAALPQPPATDDQRDAPSDRAMRGRPEL